MAGEYNIIADQGSDFSKQITITEDGVLVPNTGFSARGEIRTDKTPTGTVVETFTCAFDADGVVVFSLTHVQTAAVAAGVYWYDIEIYADDASSVVRYLEGKFTLNQEITRA